MEYQNSNKTNSEHLLQEDHYQQLPNDDDNMINDPFGLGIELGLGIAGKIEQLGHRYNSNKYKYNSHSTIQTIDQYFTSIYQYYIQGGLLHILLSQLTNVLALGFTIAFSIFLIVYFDWGKVTNCKDEESCGSSISHYIFTSPFKHHNILLSFFMILYIILCACFWLWCIILAIYSILNAFEIDEIYRTKLGISYNMLQNLKWNDITERLIQLHDNGLYRVVEGKEFLTEHDIVLHIMRKENYLIAFINKELLNLQVPWWMSYLVSENLLLTKSLEWSLSFCILEYIFTERLTISIDFLRNKRALERRFFTIGVIHFLLLPFMLIFMIIHFFLQNAQQFHSSKSYLGPRQWSPLALWKFREFNELPHYFDDRITKSYEVSNKYIELFSNQYYIIIAKFVAYISGSVVAVLLLISVISEGVVLFVHFADHNLLWYLGIFSALYAGARSMIPNDKATNEMQTHEELLEQMSAYTHYYPLHWIDGPHTTKVMEEVRYLFPYKVQIFAMEIFSIILTPAILCFSLPQSSSNIIEFIREHSKYVDGVGTVCDYALFEFEKYGDERFGAPVDGNFPENDRPLNGKLEQSYMNFRSANPNWEGDSIGRAMEEKIQYYRIAKENDRELSRSFIRENHILSTSQYNFKNQKLHVIDEENNINSSFSHNDVNSTATATNILNEMSKPLAPSVNVNVARESVKDNQRSQLIQQNADIPQVLRSILRNENIDYENDFYWMAKFRKDRMADPDSLERSCLNSKLFLSGIELDFDQQAASISSPTFSLKSPRFRQS